MEKGLSRKKVVICGSRKLEEMCALIEKQGGIPLLRPLQGTVFLAEKEVEADIIEFVETGADWVILTTGIGTETLVDLAGKLGLEEQFLKRLHGANIACRGYKTVAALKKLDITPVAIAEDGTTKGLSQALHNVDFSGKSVMIQLHGESAPALTQFFESRGAEVQKILPYQHIPPKEETLATLTKEILGNECDAVCFTTAVQVRSLFDYARQHSIHQEIVDCLNKDTLAAAVGKVTADALREEGVERIIVPDDERMGAMIIKLAQHYSS
jgi:uroporphyrinogen-III synthase